MNLLARARHRRGMLLLLVLIMLTLFVLMGAFLLVMSIRARSAARAFANATQVSAVEAIQARGLLDEALLIALRGSKDPDARAQITESILGDKYGTLAGSGTVVLNYSPTSPLLAASIDGFSISPRAMFGRVLTLSTGSSAFNAERGLPVSFRIVGANSGTAFLANAPARPDLRLPATGTYGRSDINGREFAFTGTATIGTTAAEPWDAYDRSNIWLAHPVLKDGQVERFQRASFGGNLEVDNDNDGVADGSWLSRVLPDRPSPNGTYSYRVSYLILDLDGRINVNASPFGSGMTSGAATLGMGYGPAEVDATGLLVSATAPVSAEIPMQFDGIGPMTSSSGMPSLAQRRPPPGITRVGRYGQDGSPGARGDDGFMPNGSVSGYQQTGVWNYPTTDASDQSLYGLTVAGTKAVADLKGRARVTMLTGAMLTGTLNGQDIGKEIMPRLSFDLADRDTFDADGVDDPYEVRLDAAAPRPTLATSATSPAGVNDDNPYAAADMERLLRANDTDAAALPQRLAAATGTMAQRLRMRITTDSWDTPALTGAAAGNVEAFLTGLSGGTAIAYPWQPTNPVSPEVAAGLRFNLNRPVITPADKQEYCKGLYTLLVKLGGTFATSGTGARTWQDIAAQWTVNVLDFRDEDSIMTRFVYDREIRDGWNPGTTATGTVFGIERPDLLIAETALWSSTVATGTTGQLFVNLHRPAWGANVISTSSTTPLPKEWLADELSGTSVGTTGTRTLDLSGSFYTTMPRSWPAVKGYWQLRYDDNKVVQFCVDSGGSGVSGTTQWAQTIVNGTPTITSGTVSLIVASGTVNPLKANGALCIHPPAPHPFFSVDTAATGTSGTAAVGLASGTVGVFFRTTSGTVWLERLADPTRANSPDNPYLIVDSAPVTNIDVEPPPAPPPTADELRKSRRPGPDDPGAAGRGLAVFWNGSSVWRRESGKLTAYSGASASNPVPWLHWPNRPFVSVGELALVPAHGPAAFLGEYADPPVSLVSGTVIEIINTGTESGTTVITGTTFEISARSMPAAVMSGAAVTGPVPVGRLLLDAAHVPSRFAGTSLSFTGASGAALAPVGLDLLRAGQMSAWREPGKINVNTIVPGEGEADSPVWSAIVSGSARQFQRGSGPESISQSLFRSDAARSLADVLALKRDDRQPIARDVIEEGSARDLNPFFNYATAIRLANTATTRSQVFAVWITLETTDSADDSKTYHRLFAIVDRSIPVGFREGENLNVRDTIRLQRFLE